ncbi:hypothetical protein [Dickeya zeae]|uniref:hypothetical protein n=1 Tax=Dickeya zeae TaxID=204042 RepID=UPI001FF0CBCA|nr:hypothetical protein [Dickeya zeae]
MGYQAIFLDKERSDLDYESSLAELYINPQLNPQPTRCDESVRVLVYENDIPYLLLHAFIEVDEDGCFLDSCFRQVLCNDKYVAIMLGQHIHLVEVVSKEIKISIFMIMWSILILYPIVLIFILVRAF